MSKHEHVEQVYVALLEEGIDVWRPAPALKVRNSVYVILRPENYDPEDEVWQYPPGSVVECAMRKLADGEVLAAIGPSQALRRSA